MALTQAEVSAILEPPTTSVTNAGRLLGLSRNVAYEAAARGDFQSIRMGGRIVVPTAPLRKLLGIEA